MFFKSKKPVLTKPQQTRHIAKAAVGHQQVAEKRWVHRNQLEIGMYVNELDKPWEQTRFMFQGFKIDSQETLEAVQQACEYANVQTFKLAIVPQDSVYRLVGATR